MNNKEDTVSNILSKRFDKRKSWMVVNYFTKSTQKLEQCDWENSLVQSGKFVETTIKLIWDFAEETLPKAKEFKVGVYAQKIIQLSSNKIPNDGIRLQIPRACIFLYDIVSNRGGRHISDEFDPNKMDAITVSALCSWVLAEIEFLCLKYNIT